MTRYKKHLKDTRGQRFSEDYPFLPYDFGMFTIEDVDAYVIRGGVVLCKRYTSYCMRMLYTSKHGCLLIEDSADEISPFKRKSIAYMIKYNDENVVYCFNNEDKLIAAFIDRKGVL